MVLYHHACIYQVNVTQVMLSAEHICKAASLERKSRRMMKMEKRSRSSHLMHLQVVVRGSHLGIQGTVGIRSVVFQTATLLQMGLQLLSAPPEEKGKITLLRMGAIHCSWDLTTYN